MPELPDLTVYVEALEQRMLGRKLEALRITNPFFLRTADPPPDTAVGRTVQSVRRRGKRIVFTFEGDVSLAVHLMIAGRLHWRARAPEGRPRGALALFVFPSGALVVTEAGTRHRASLHVLEGPDAPALLDRGGIEILEADLAAFRAALTRESHTVKRALTDPRLFSGLGNAYSDEILHAARLSPLKLTRSLAEEEVVRLHESAREVTTLWIERLRTENEGRFPERVTAFHPGMAVHGKFGRPCPVCGGMVQRIRYAENECNYCPTCQTEGRLAADRALSRLLKDDWPRSLEELEDLKDRFADRAP